MRDGHVVVTAKVVRIIAQYYGSRYLFTLCEAQEVSGFGRDFFQGVDRVTLRHNQLLESRASG